MTAGTPVEYIEAKTLSLSDAFNVKSAWHVSAYTAKDLDAWTEAVAQGTSKDDSDRPLRICFWSDPKRKNAQCQIAQIPSTKETGPTFQHLVELKTLCLQAKPVQRMGVLLQAKNEGYGLGLASTGLNYASVWAYNPKRARFETVLQPVSYSDQGEFQILPGTGNPSIPLAVVADFVWGDGESRYGRHHFLITLYQLKAQGLYEYATRYTTQDTYPSLDEVEEIDVISHELSAITNAVTPHP